MRQLTDLGLIVILIICVAVVVLLDDGAGQRWCDTYQICEENYEKN